MEIWYYYLLFCLEYEKMKRADFSRSVKACLENNKMTPRELAALMGFSYNRACHLTHSKSVTLTTIQNFADKFGMSASEVIALGELEEKNAGV